MPTPERMIVLLQQAREVVLRTPGRRGHLVDLQDCDEILVIGDLHGHVPNFQAIWTLADLAKHPRRHLVVQELIHGKFPASNGGEKSHQLVDLFAVALTQFPGRIHYLPGNHEMAQWTGRKILKGESNLNEFFRKGVVSSYGERMMPEVYKGYLELWQACPLGLRTPNRVFLSHTLPPGRQLPLFEVRQLEAESFAPKDLEPNGTVYGMLWGRDTTEETVIEFLRKVECDWLITGHIPADAGYSIPNPRQIALDCSNVPGGYVLFSADREIPDHGELKRCIGTV